MRGIVVFLASMLILSGCELMDIFDVEVDLKAQEAIDKKDPALCEEIEDERDARDTVRRRDNCYVKVAAGLKDLKICDNLVEQDKNAQECKQGVAVAKEDIKLCKELEGSRVRNCITDIAVNQKKMHTCHELETDSDKYSCYHDVGIAKESVDICEQIHPSASHSRNDCFNQIAVKKNDETICNSIGQESLADRCRTSIALKKNDETICEGNSFKNFCWMQMAAKQQDFSLCLRMKDDYDGQDNCLGQVAVLKSEVSICKKIDEPEREYDCIAFIAENMKNPSLCEGLPADAKKECIEDAS
ncbi:hypothetical protein GOV09_06325 [Candidatus Woesearchaeota archaeon]|nr:hypothetical protein [Candidatus Woesearchaeota archaeon]